MELTGDHRIAASRQEVWNALNDPEVLRACIPGCETLTQKGDNGYDAIVQAKVGPVRARFSGTVVLSNIVPPESYTIAGEGKGGTAGMAKGSADVVLKEDGDGTVLSYTVNADVGGKLAQIGSRLVQSAANKQARDFFSRFGDIVTGAEPVPGDVPAEAASAASRVLIAAPARGRDDENAAHLRRLNWAFLAIIVALIAYILATH